MPVKVVKVWVSVVQDLRKRRTRRVTAPAKVRKSMAMKTMLGFFLAGESGGPPTAPGAPGGPPGGGGPPTGGAPGGWEGTAAGTGHGGSCAGCSTRRRQAGTGLGCLKGGFRPCRHSGYGSRSWGGRACRRLKGRCWSRSSGRGGNRGRSGCRRWSRRGCCCGNRGRSRWGIRRRGCGRGWRAGAWVRTVGGLYFGGERRTRNPELGAGSVSGLGGLSFLRGKFQGGLGRLRGAGICHDE